MERKINCVYVERTEDGKLNIYGAIATMGVLTIEVVLSTKNQPALMVECWGEKYTTRYIREKMKTRPTHNFIGYLSGPLSYPVNEKRFKFV